MFTIDNDFHPTLTQLITFLKTKYKIQQKEVALESALMPIIIDFMTESKNKTIIFSEFWDKIKHDISGHFDYCNHI